MFQQKQVDGALLYVEKYSRHINSIELKRVSRATIPFSLQLSRVQLQTLGQMQQLTHLELASITPQRTGEASPALQPLQALTGLVDLRLNLPWPRGWGTLPLVSDSMLSGMQHLTRLELCAVKLEPGVLAGKTKVQHLHMTLRHLSEGEAVGTAQMLSDLQHMQQLTHLALHEALCAYEMEWDDAADDGSDSYQELVEPPAAAYAALTASSKLQYLHLSSCSLPVGVWQHVFPAGRQLPHLQTLVMSGITRPSGLSASAPDGLVSCCPNLRVLDMQQLQGTAKLLAPLQGLSGLHTLRLAPLKTLSRCRFVDAAAVEGFEAVAELTGLRELSLNVP
jgi:hypothetical protein